MPTYDRNPKRSQDPKHAHQRKEIIMQTMFERTVFASFIILSLTFAIQAAEPPNPSALVGKPVAAGTYEYRFDAKRIGDVLAGTVTVKSPNGKESVCQCFGSLE